jgi:hypothetical protein
MSACYLLDLIFWTISKMKEAILHFVWQLQKFNKVGLQSTQDERVEVFSVGNHNTDAGPDFLNAKIRIGKITWSGHVEIHINSSDWNHHGHQNDPAYDNVILHVVWKNDLAIKREDGKSIPTIELNGRVSLDMLGKCKSLINSPHTIPCANQIGSTNSMEIFSMQQQAAIERLNNKSSLVFELLEQNKMDWEETAYQLLAKNFGFKINSDSFLNLSKQLPFKILKKHSENTLQLEALLFGLAGMLQESPKDEYHSALMNEYAFLSKKYKLEGSELHGHLWKYLRLRPGNFPAVRISQLSALLNRHPHIFDLFTGFEDAKQLGKMLRLAPSEYWQSHYNFCKPSIKKLNGIGKNSTENLLINTAVPLLAAYSQYTDESKYMDKALSILESLSPEKNKITRMWEELEVSIGNSFESQALIELHNNYCLKKRCLSCKIGVGLINQS